MDPQRPFTFLDDRLGRGLAPRPGQYLPATRTRTSTRGKAAASTTAPSTLPKAGGQSSPTLPTFAAHHRHAGVTIRDIEHKARLNAQADSLSGQITTMANAITATGIAAAKLEGKKLDEAFLSLYVTASNNDTEKLATLVKKNLQDPRPAGTVKREPFHWPLSIS